MVFTPPPSPLPPRYPRPNERDYVPVHVEDDDDSSSSEKGSEQSFLAVPGSPSEKPTAPKLSMTTLAPPGLPSSSPLLTPNPLTPSSSSSASNFARTRRRVLVWVVPIVLLLIASTSGLITTRHQHNHWPSTSLHSSCDDKPRRPTFSGIFRDPTTYGPMRNETPTHLDGFWKHIHGPKAHKFAAGGSHHHGAPAGPTPTTSSPGGQSGSTEDVEPRAVFAHGLGDAPTFPQALAAAGGSGESTTTSSTAQGIPTDAPKNVASATAPAIPATPWPVPTPFPQPFDSTISYNFSSSTCLSFFTTQLANETFRACRPFGLLFATSSDFFSIETNLTALTAVEEGTCNTVPTADTCVGIMDWMASQMLLSTVCRTDLADQNAIALEALYGFRSYSFYREAGCLVNNKTGAYCFAEALAESTPEDLYYFSLPLGTPIPGTDNVETTTLANGVTTTTTAVTPGVTYAPTCSTCVAALMDIFAPFASRSDLLLGLTYPPAASAANKQCGTGYAPGPETIAANASPTPPVPVSTTTSEKATSAAWGISVPVGTMMSVVVGMMMLGVLSTSSGAWAFL
ncbi:hypothetical protein DL93DRAFT_1773336 [Clavulina sp. PMI_390]|nr:hypothetical protein DL93DRAFT_1773336 [Clavulina sp. PMI_390]